MNFFCGDGRARGEGGADVGQRFRAGWVREAAVARAAQTCWDRRAVFSNRNCDATSQWKVCAEGRALRQTQDTPVDKCTLTRPLPEGEGKRGGGTQ